ncbi:MAG: quinone-dependent dihydroorotate dehydrogenase [Bacteroidota bacterium]
MYNLVKPLLFSLAPENAHHFTVKSLKRSLTIPGARQIIQQLYGFEHPNLKRNLLGLTFQNPVGLAAGFDKDGQYINEMSSLGFGFIEVGTVTPKPQSGNPQPRLFRLPDDDALINRMGFNNQGVDALVEQLKKERPEGIIIGGNIGKNKVTPNEQAADDYTYTFDALFPYVDYFVVNVSSPNTPNLRSLQEKEPLTHLLKSLQARNQAQEQPKPMLLKIAPDLTFEQINEVIEIVEEVELEGIIATNTTISREQLKTTHDTITTIGNGGLSGAPLRERATAVIRYIRERAKKDLVIIGVGGITTAEDALEKIEAGADLVQVYTGLVYRGPVLVKDIKKALV